MSDEKEAYIDSLGKLNLCSLIAHSNNHFTIFKFLVMNFSENYFFIQFIDLFFSFLIFFLSLWIILPAPNSILLRLSVGSPEISHWLTLISIVNLVINLLYFKVNKYAIFCVNFNLLTLVLTILIYIRISPTLRQFNQQFSDNFGLDYQKKINESIKTKIRTKPIKVIDLFRGIPIDKVRINRGIIFAKFEQINLKLNLYRPLERGKYPTLIILYGGAWKNGKPDDNEQFSRYFASQGYTVINIDYRHAPQYRFPCQLEDVELACQYIKKNAVELEVDLDKIAIMGRSAGGQLAKIKGYTNNILNFKAVIGYYSPVNLTKAYYDLPTLDPIKTRPILLDFLGDTPDNLPDLYKKASPTNYVKKDLPPTLLIYAQRDNVVSPNAGKLLTDKLLKSENQVIFLVIPWADHCFDAVFSGISNQVALFYTQQFLDQVLAKCAKKTSP